MSKQQLSVEEFVVLAINKLRVKEGGGIHTVYSGFNEAFREYFPGLDPIKEVKKLERAGKIVSRPTRGGRWICLPKDFQGEPPKGQVALKRMGLKSG